MKLVVELFTIFPIMLFKKKSIFYRELAIIGAGNGRISAAMAVVMAPVCLILYNIRFSFRVDVFKFH